MKNFHIGLLPRIIIAIILGILFGNFLPASLVRLFVTFNAIFSEFLNFSIPLIIVGLVTIAIADIGKGAGRMLVITALIAYGATLFSGFLSYFTGMAVFPSLIETGVSRHSSLFFRGYPALDECYDRTRTCLHTGAGPGSSEK